MALKRCAATRGSPPTALPPSAPATTIAGSSSTGLAAGPKCERNAAAGDRADDELALGADVPDVGAKADRQPHRDQHQRRRLEQQLADAVEIARSGSTKKRGAPANGFLPSSREQMHSRSTTVSADRDQRRQQAHRSATARARGSSLISMRSLPIGDVALIGCGPRAGATCRLISTPISSRLVSRRRAWPATAGPWRSPRGGRRSRTARPAPRRPPAPRSRRRAGRSAPGGSARRAPTSTPQVGCATISTLRLLQRSRGRR